MISVRARLGPMAAKSQGQLALLLLQSRGSGGELGGLTEGSQARGMSGSGSADDRRGLASRLHKAVAELSNSKGRLPPNATGWPRK